MLLAQVWETEIHVAVLDHALASGLLTLLGISQVARCDNGIEVYGDGMGNVTLTHEFIDSCKTPGGAWNRKQLNALGVAWPPRQGWKSKLVGTVISAKQAREFRDLAGMYEFTRHDNGIEAQA